MDINGLIFLGVGIIVGLPIGWLIYRVQYSSKMLERENLTIQLKVASEKATRFSSELQEADEKLTAERKNVIQLSNEKSVLKTRNQYFEEKLEEQKGEMSKLQQQFALEFKNLANEIFEEKSKKFTNQNKTNLDELLNPLSQKISEFEKKVEQTNKDNLITNTALKEQIINLKELNNRITKETENLTKALKGDVKMQGNWGEVILESILEKSGLEKNREYFTQETLQNEDGRRLRPDVIIKLPDNKNLIIDAKMSLVAYEKFMNTEDMAAKEKHLKDHILSIKAHVRGLAEKNYQQLFDMESLDYVLMFIPIEPAFALVVQHGGEIYNEAHEKNIIIVSPTTLIATLRTISSIWKHEHQSRNSQEIARQGGALYDKFKSFVDDLIAVGISMDRSKQQYTTAMNKLVDGGDNLIRKTERLRELGAKTSKIMNEKLSNKANINKE